MADEAWREIEMQYEQAQLLRDAGKLDEEKYAAWRDHYHGKRGEYERFRRAYEEFEQELVQRQGNPKAEDFEDHLDVFGSEGSNAETEADPVENDLDVQDELYGDELALPPASTGSVVESDAHDEEDELAAEEHEQGSDAHHDEEDLALPPAQFERREVVAPVEPELEDEQAADDSASWESDDLALPPARVRAASEIASPQDIEPEDYSDEAWEEVFEEFELPPARSAVQAPEPDDAEPDTPDTQPTEAPAESEDAEFFDEPETEGADFFDDHEEEPADSFETQQLQADTDEADNEVPSADEQPEDRGAAPAAVPASLSVAAMAAAMLTPVTPAKAPGDPEAPAQPDEEPEPAEPATQPDDQHAHEDEDQEPSSGELAEDPVRVDNEKVPVDDEVVHRDEGSPAAAREAVAARETDEERVEATSPSRRVLSSEPEGDPDWDPEDEDEVADDEPQHDLDDVSLQYLPEQVWQEPEPDPEPPAPEYTAPILEPMSPFKGKEPALIDPEPEDEQEEEVGLEDAPQETQPQVREQFEDFEEFDLYADDEQYDPYEGYDDQPAASAAADTASSWPRALQTAALMWGACLPFTLATLLIGGHRLPLHQHALSFAIAVLFGQTLLSAAGAAIAVRVAARATGRSSLTSWWPFVTLVSALSGLLCLSVGWVGSAPVLLAAFAWVSLSLVHESRRVLYSFLAVWGLLVACVVLSFASSGGRFDTPNKSAPKPAPAKIDKKEPEKSSVDIDYESVAKQLGAESKEVDSTQDFEFYFGVGTKDIADQVSSREEYEVSSRTRLLTVVFDTEASAKKAFAQVSEFKDPVNETYPGLQVMQAIQGGGLDAEWTTTVLTTARSGATVFALSYANTSGRSRSEVVAQAGTTEHAKVLKQLSNQLAS